MQTVLVVDGKGKVWEDRKQDPGSLSYLQLGQVG